MESVRRRVMMAAATTAAMITMRRILGIFN
jgi:hypothetical protein